MFGLPLWRLGVAECTGFGQWLGEFVATAGLVLVILGCLRHRPDAVPWAVGLYITAAYWFTSSTSFANPAVTLARAASGTFAGIRAGDVPAFLAAPLPGAAIAARLGRRLFIESRADRPPAAAGVEHA